MSISRRNFVKSAFASILTFGLPGGNVRSAMASIKNGNNGQTPREAYAKYKDWIFIDALGGLRLGKEGEDEIKRSGLTMIETTLGAQGDPTFGYEQAVKDLAMYHGIFDRFEEVLIRVRTTRDILEAKKTGKIALMLGFQNATHLARDIKNVDFFYNLGIRQIQLTYNSLNALGAGCTERKDSGLSDFGVKVVHRMNELGILVDLSHCGVKTTLDAIEVSKKTPIFSHTVCRALCDNPRGKWDDQIKKLAAKGGVMGVATVNFFISKKPRSTLDDYINHIEHVIKLVGIDHVGIGSDSSIGGWRISFPTEKAFFDFHDQFHFKPGVDLRWPPFIEEIDVPEKMYIIAERLTQRGYSTPDIKKIMGENFMRVYKEILG
ncbi:MAG: membrane dipeptidase [Candidatus Aminicenantes bacterium]|nr:MAG: membrane dipeptidase [Candidatus Aminicenantes bacterium]